MAAALALSGCGFKLRGALEFAFDSIHVNMPEQSGLGNELKRQLAANKGLRVIREPALVPTAQVILDSLVDQREKVVVGLTSSGQVREFQLRVRFKFRLRAKDGRELIPEAEILQERDISYSESNALAKEAEEQLLYRDMQSDIVQQVLRRLAAVKL
ncbi:MAG: LPS assembly lipoprotein LptE [Burkholderiales bacterium]